MATINKGSSLENDEIVDSKNAIELSENTENQARASDPALKVMGDERVVVTEEDVSHGGP
jgi:hypothetical protein